MGAVAALAPDYNLANFLRRHAPLGRVKQGSLTIFREKLIKTRLTMFGVW